MDQVWKQINSSSSLINSNRTTASFHGMFSHDFLAPTNKDPSKTAPTKYGSSVSTELSPAHDVFSSPATALSLNSGMDFQYPESSDLVKQNPLISSNKPSFFSSDFDAMPPHSSVFTTISKKREYEQNDEFNPGDRRHKRMMKNRESAARSRSRRQAYTNELELEIAHLMEENAKLKTQQEKLLMARASSTDQQQEVPKKHTLYRTSTAPF